MQYNYNMDRIFLIDNDSSLCDKLAGLGIECELVSENRGFCASNTDYVLINSDSCPKFLPNGEGSFGLILLSGNMSGICTEQLERAHDIFCSTAEIERAFRPCNSICSDGFFGQTISRAELYLRYVGMDDRLSGFSYLGFLTAYITLSPCACMKYDIYPLMEKRFKKEAASLERSMRYAIEKAWNTGDMRAQQEVFGYSVSPERGKPVTRELCAGIAEKIREDMENDRIQAKL